MAQSLSTLATAVCGVENSMATSTPRNFSGVMPCWFTLVSMSSFRPTENPASAASCSISLPIFPYPTIAKFLSMVCLRFAEKGTRHLRVGIDGGKQFAF